LNKLEKYTPCGAVAPATAKLLLLMLRDITNDNDFVIIPQRRIAEAIGMSRSAVSRNLRRLEQADAIAIEPLYSQYGGRLPNKYILRKGSKKHER
jgi:DNA-binding MarR family transcriptional regulator